MDRIICMVAAVLMLAFIVSLIFQDKANVIPIFATLALVVAALGSVDYDDW